MNFCDTGERMVITQLQHFIEVYNSNSFTQAAENCFITIQGMSMSISRLEHELGCRLFKRTTKGAFPTGMGEYLYPRAKEIIKIVGECEAYFASNSDTRKSVAAMFTLGTIELFAHSTIAKFREMYPGISVYIHNGTDAECENSVINGDVEFALCAGPIDSHRFDATLLYTSKNVLVVNNEHPLARKRTVDIYDLKSIPLSLRTKATKSTKTLFLLCNEAGFDPHVFSYVDDLRLAIYLAEINQSCGVMNLTTAEKISTPNLTIIPFECEEMDWKVYLLKNKKALFQKETRDFESLLLKSDNTR